MSNHASPILPLYNPPATGGSAPHLIPPAGAGASGNPYPDDDLPAGYPKFAEKMCHIPETAIFRRFGTLNAQNLLYLQAELVSMEERLRKLQRVDATSSVGKKSKYARNWFYLSQSRKDGDEKQWRLVRRIRQTLKEYNSTIIEQAKILRMQAPSRYDLDHVQRFLETDVMGPLALTGRDSGTWGSMKEPESHAKDLVALLFRHDEDSFSKWVTERASLKLFKLPPCWRRAWTSQKTHDLDCLEDRILLRWTHHLTSILASALPILYRVRSLEIRLGIIAIFNLILSLCLTIFTTAKRTDIFAVTAAFSAVQVVFVQVGTETSL